MTAPTPAGPGPDAERAPAAAPDRAEQVLARFGRARLWAAARAPYLARALFALQPVLVEAHLDEDTGEPVADPALRAFPTDTRWRVHLDPGTALATPVAEIGWWMLHHIGHLVRHHAERAPAPPPGPAAGFPRLVSAGWKPARTATRALASGPAGSKERESPPRSTSAGTVKAPGAPTVVGPELMRPSLNMRGASLPSSRPSRYQLPRRQTRRHGWTVRSSSAPR